MEIYGEKNIHHKDTYFFYKKTYDANIKYKARQYKDWAVIHRELWREIGNQIIESEAGVYIAKFGYIAAVMLPEKKIVDFVKSHTIKRKYYNDHSDNKIYTINYFSNLVKNSKFRYWTLDRCFNLKMKKKFSVELVRGKKYQLKYTLLKKIYLGRDTITKEIAEERKLNENR